MITLGDIYYILFRHKWKIAIITTLGLIAAMIVPVVWPRSYTSEAELLIKYVLDSRVPTGPEGHSSRVTLPDEAGRNIINTELHILTSLDLAQEVATNIGSAKILGKEGNPLAAAARIHKNLTVDVPLNSDVIRITFRHSDPQVVQQVLKQIIDTYKERHMAIHRPGGAFDDALQQETDQLKASLKNIDESIRNAKTNLNIVSVEDSQKVFGDQMTKIQQDIFDADAELAGHEASVTEMSKHTTLKDALTNVVKAADAGSVPVEKTAEYKRVAGMLEMFRTKEKELLGIYLPENSRVKDVQVQIETAEKQKKQLEDENPGLLAVKAADAPKAPDSTSDLQNKMIEETSRIAALQRKIQVLTNQLAFIQGRASAVDAEAANINQLERTRKQEQLNYDFYTQTLIQSHVEESSGPGKGSNIDVIQSPSSPFLDNSKMTKASMGVAVAGLMLALGIAFLIELYLDRTLRRPADVEARLGVPLFLSIPYRNGNSNKRLLNAPAKAALVLTSETVGRPVFLNGSKTTIGRLPENTVVIEDGSISQHHCEIFSRNGEVIVKDLGSTNGTFINGERIVEGSLKADQTLRVGNLEFQVGNQNNVKDLVAARKTTEVTPPWDPRHALRPFYDTLRDRLITYFEVKNLTHNPKLVALTSCGDSAGVTSTAAGLAAALSETGDGNVLLVDMNVERGAAHHFYKGHLSCGIDEALTKEKRHEARVQNNLYVVTESASEDSLPRVLPKRFMSLVPKLKASDYDYIIFDMPPMSQISITPRLARYMDMVMVVVESEKSDRDVVQRAVAMLAETRANVGVVLNKRKTYVPERIQPEL
jgi:uncharacterized protein involved in exopolysaccharide biosynthesis/Mrp family chromosome partitioning ATPase